MTRFRPLALAALMLPLLAGCGLFGGKSDDYKTTRMRETPLEVPPDLTAPTYDDRYAIPDPKASTSFSQYQQGRASGTPAAAGPGGPAVLPPIANARVERAGDIRYVVVKAEPAQVWPVVREFWLDQGFSIAREDAAVGVMETNWRENRPRVEDSGLRGFMGRYLPGMYSTGERDRFRSRIERGAEPGTVEIYVSHRGLEEAYTSMTQDTTRWVPRAGGTDRGLEAEMLQGLVLKLGAPTKKSEPVRQAEAKSGTAPIAGEVASPAKVGAVAPSSSQNAVLQGGGAGPIVLNDGFDRAWRRVGLALDRVGFTVEDRDRSKGMYFVRYIDPDAQKTDNEGFLDKLAFWKPVEKGAAPQFRLAVTDAGGGFTNVTLQDSKGAPDASPTGKRILSLLYEQLK